MGRFLFLLFALVGFAALLNFVPGCSVSQNADELEAKANAAFAQAGIDSVSADVSGNVMRLSGSAADAGQKARAVQLAEGVRCEDCEDRFHEVVDETTVAEAVAPELPLADPYVFTARKTDDGRVVLNGNVPDSNARTRVLREARALFGAENVVDETITIARGVPDANWGEAIALNLNELSRLDTGRLSMSHEADDRDTQVLLTGRAATADVRREINELAEDEPDGYNQVLNIEVIGEAVENVGELDSEAVCQELLDELNANNEIQFATDSANLLPGRPQEVLNTLAGAMNQCPGFNVEVEGHASHSGGEQYNMDLSRDRAATVVTYLSNEADVDMDRLSSEGFGETRPKVETNDPNSDLAVNRRIEFIVSR